MTPSNGLVHSIYSTPVQYYVDIKEVLELHEHLCKYYTRLTGKSQREFDELTKWYRELLPEADGVDCDNFLMRVARTLERNSANKTFILEEHSLVGIGTATKS